MLRNNLYTVDSVSETHSPLLVSVKLNPQHPIFKGHFPGQPVLPGVCMLEMIQEMMEEQLHQKLRISGGLQVKFLAMILPDKNPRFLVELNYDQQQEKISVSGKIFHEKTIFMKYSLSLIQEPA